MRIVTILVLALALAAGTAVAFAQEREFRLKDGSVVRGELISRENHVYQIKTKAFGTVSVKDSDVISMDSASSRPVLVTPEMFTRRPVVTEQEASPTPPPTPQEVLSNPVIAPTVAPAINPPSPAQATGLPDAAQLAAPAADITQKILGDPAAIESMMSLASDPMLLDMMADPQIKAALANNDMEFLKNNEKFLSFMNNPAVKDLTKKILGGSPQEKQQQ